MDEEEKQDKEEKEYVLLEFEDGWLPNSGTHFTLSGLDTINPTLVLENGTRLAFIMSMQRLLNEEDLSEKLQENHGMFYEESQQSSAPLPAFNEPHVLNPHIFAPLFSSSSRGYFRMPPPTTPPTHPGFQASFPSYGCTQSEQTPPMVGVSEQVVNPSQGVTNAAKPKGRKLKEALSQADAAISKPPLKRSKRKTKTGQNSDANVDDGDNESGRSQWKDPWVVSLIHERGGMNDKFNKPQKQGVDLWSKIANMLASLHTDFNKDSEACRKKWGRVYDNYKADRVHNSISGNDF